MREVTGSRISLRDSGMTSKRKAYDANDHAARMKLETFFDKFELFADAPNAVAKMRELVLALAVQGELTAAHTASNDWKVSKLGELATKIGSGATPLGGKAAYQESGVPLIRSMNIYFGRFDRQGLVFLNDEQAGKLKGVTVNAGDVLLNITGASIGRVSVAPKDMDGGRVNQHVCIIRTTTELHSRFLELFLASPIVQATINDIQVGATRQALTKAMIERFEIPLPPIAEQKRIVAKVDELMALCDLLEAQQQERETRHAALSCAALARFAEGPTQANLEFLFHKSYTIPPADLRKSILTLAVQGKLAPSHRADQRAQFPGSNRSDLPDIPDHWTWSDMGMVVTRMDSGWSPACESNPADPTEWGVLRTTAVQTNAYREDENKRLPKNLEPRPDAEVRDGDVLFTRAGPINRVGIVCVARPTRAKLMISDKIIRFHLLPDIDPDYAALALNAGFSNYFIESLKSGMAASQVNISQPKLKTVPIPLPPLAEQRRIVAKVDELMAMVDKLEAQLASARTTATNLLAAAVAELTNGKEPLSA